METKQLGNTGVMVAEIGIGVWRYRGRVEPLRRGIELGATLIDTAEVYGTEDVVGQAIRGIRDRVFVATKVSGTHLRHDDLLRAGDASLRRLGSGFIDLYQIHWPNSAFPSLASSPLSFLDTAKATDNIGRRVEIYCAEEMYVPDYSAQGIDLSRSVFGTAWFQTCWAFEESRHGLVFREYLRRSGLRSQAQVEDLETTTLSRHWQLPFQTRRQMACYGALQEGATYTAYNVQRNQARGAGDEVLEAIFPLVGRDEAAHAGFYRSMIQLELSISRAETIADLAWVLANLKMPGDGLIPDYKQRLQSSGAGISPRLSIERVVSPLLRTLEIKREEMKTALRG